MLIYRPVQNHDELEQLVNLEIYVWQMSERGAVPEHIMQVIRVCGGSILGAFEEERMVGFTLALLAKRRGSYLAWSHMAAVHPDYRSQGIGFRLKQEQRLWALSQGYDTIGWTFDPMRRRNAKFNLRHLGVRIGVYHPDFYGEMTDALNAGMPSDRFEVTWALNDPRVVAHAAGNLTQTTYSAQDHAFLLESSDGETARLADDHLATLDESCYFIELPYSIHYLWRQSQQRVIDWQLLMRDAFLAAFDAGYQVVDLADTGSRAWYVLQMP